MTPRNHSNNDRSRQSGSALIVGLIFLLVMTMLGLTAMQTTSLEERMAGNLRDKDLAAQVAEMALRAGEIEALGTAALNGNGYFSFPANPAPNESVAANWVIAGNTRAWVDGGKLTSITSGTNPNGSPILPSLAEPPAYWIEERPGVYSSPSLELRPPDVAIFDITARSTGASGTSTVILRSTVMQ